MPGRITASLLACLAVVSLSVAPATALDENPPANPVPSRANADPALEVIEPELKQLRVHDGGYNIRIPAIATAPNGDLLAAYDYRPINGGSNGGDSPNANSIRQRRSTDNGKTWLPETDIVTGATGANREGYSDPSYVVDTESGRLFNFHVFSRKSGVFANYPSYRVLPDGSIDEDHDHTMNLGLSVSYDNGHTWQHRVITSQVLSPLVAKHKLLSCFATSGAGTQKSTEPHQGRLLQQFACVADTNGNGVAENNVDNIVALTVYSDDHGETWHAGQPTDPHGIPGKRLRFDENKVVELSDGTLMLNSRTSTYHGAGHRIVALSSDGGESWGSYRIDESVTDPGNNAQIIRAFPDAKPGTLRSRVLLFSNTNDADDRTNGTLWLSYDDGATWATHKTFHDGGTGYTTMAIQADGSIGILLEPEVWNDIGYINTSLSWVTDDLQTEIKAKEVEPIRVTGGTNITPIKLSDLFDHLDPLLADSVSLNGLPKGIIYNPDTGMIEGSLENGAGETKFSGEVKISEEDDGTGRPRTATTSLTFILEKGAATENQADDETATKQSSHKPERKKLTAIPSGPTSSGGELPNLYAH